jgi:hypothetical protein
MPAHTAEQVAERCVALSKKLAAQAEKAAPARRRAMRKRLKRAQRKRRKLAATASRLGARKAEAKG